MERRRTCPSHTGTKHRARLFAQGSRLRTAIPVDRARIAPQVRVRWTVARDASQRRKRRETDLARDQQRTVYNVRLSPMPVVLACACVLASCGTKMTTTRPTRQTRPTHPAVRSQGVAATSRPSLNAEGTSSTPGVFQLPQMGFVGFRCDHTFRVQPFFDRRGATAEEEVTLRAPGITRRNFTTRMVGRYRGKPLRETTFSPESVVALPFAHYGTVTFIVRTGSEARALNAKVTAQFVAGIFKNPTYPPLGACYVKHWLVSISVNPY